MTGSTERPLKLIEVALPLDEINAACKAYKDRKVGTIRNIHKWFAAMPLPAWRALLFASLIDDPRDEERRAYLLDVIKRLVANGADIPDEDTLTEARGIIDRQFPDGAPPVIDPFCGGGSTLVEAQRLGLTTFGSDLNPVPALITRTLTQLLPPLYGLPPLHPGDAEDGMNSKASKGRGKTQHDGLFNATSERSAYRGFEGVICDTTYYAEQILARGWDRLHDAYPSTLGESSIAWLWARTAACPNPACGIETILTTSWWLCKKKGELAWIEPHVDSGVVILDVVSGQMSGVPPEPPKIGRGAAFSCLACGATLDDTEVKRQANESGGLGLRMTAVVAQTENGRIYRAPTDAEIAAAIDVQADNTGLDVPIASDPRSMWCFLYGITTWDLLFSSRQLVALATFADLVAETHAQILSDGGTREWADAVTSLLGLAVGKLAQSNSTQVRWNTSVAGSPKGEPAFGRNDLPMLWDFVETYPFGSSVGSFAGIVRDQVRSVNYLTRNAIGVAVTSDARSVSPDRPGLVATDPPYFDAIGYADLSDYFYIWHRRALRAVHPDLYSTVAAPKQGELTALPIHHGNSKDNARDYFISGFTEAFGNLQDVMAPSLPLIVVYASKEQEGGGAEETRWSSILTAMVDADLEITGTWPIHGTTAARLIGNETNAVAAYVVMVCRPRSATAGSCSLADFNRALRRELKSSVHDLQAAGILPVDLAQAAMGPGMQIYSRYREVVDQSGRRVAVDQALRFINSALGEVLDEQEGELDPDSRFAVAWWDKYGWEPATFGEADQLARPQGISVDDVIRAGVATYPKAGFVSLVGLKDMNREWLPSNDTRPTAWEAVHHLADRLIDGGGVVEAGRLMGQLGLLRDPAQGLVYRLHEIAARKGRAKDQERYNSLIGSWSDCMAISATEKDGLF